MRRQLSQVCVYTMKRAELYLEVKSRANSRVRGQRKLSVGKGMTHRMKWYYGKYVKRDRSQRTGVVVQGGREGQDFKKRVARESRVASCWDFEIMNSQVTVNFGDCSQCKFQVCIHWQGKRGNRRVDNTWIKEESLLWRSVIETSRVTNDRTSGEKLV